MSRSRRSTLAFVANIVALVFCFVPAIAGILLSARSDRLAGSRPEAADRSLRWSWICFALALALFLLYVVFFLVTQPESTLGALGLT